MMTHFVQWNLLHIESKRLNIRSKRMGEITRFSYWLPAWVGRVLGAFSPHPPPPSAQRVPSAVGFGGRQLPPQPLDSPISNP